MQSNGLSRECHHDGDGDGGSRKDGGVMIDDESMVEKMEKKVCVSKTSAIETACALRASLIM